MKTQILKFSIIGCIIMLILASTSVSSCKKDKTCHGVVTVIDSTNTRVKGATVTLDQLTASNGPGQVMYHAITDGNGEADFSISLPAIFNIKATQPNYPTQEFASGVLNVDEPGKSSTVIVTIK